MGNLNCEYHPSQKAESSCPVCLKQICELCQSADEFKIVCVSCIKKQRVQKKIKWIFFLLILTLIAGGSYHLISTYDKPFNYKNFTNDVWNFSEHMEKEPCDRTAIIKFLDILVKAGDNRRATDETRKFTNNCGEYPRSLWISFTAFKRLSQFDSAVTIATRIIEYDKYDVDYWWWRGEAYQQWGKYAEAIADYRQSINLNPRLNGMQIALADLLEKAGKPCEAIFPLEELVFHNPELRQHNEITKRFSSLYDGRCSEFTGTGKAIIKFNPGSSIYTNAKIDNKSIRNLLFDTGASYVVINQTSADKLGLANQNAKKIFVQTAGGIRSAKLTSAKEFKVKGLTAKYIEIAIMKDSDLGPNINGLLGLSFLSRFNFSVDYNKGRVTISQK